MRLRSWRGTILLVATLLPLGLAACRTTQSTTQLMALAGPQIPGAEYVGMDTCAECHAEQAKRYQLTSHFGTSLMEGETILGEACESCHGAGSRHVEALGDPTLIVRESPDRCFVCHADKKAEFQLQYHHPVPEGWMSCTSCHDPHGEDVSAWSATSVLRPGELCFTCHKEQKGPFVFEHDPVRNGCQECHNPHGSPFEKLLVADSRTLCLRCHWEVTVNTVPGRIADFSHGAGGANFHIGRGADCVDCHTAPHGSNIQRAFEH